MSKHAPQKKSPAAQATDWHPADIIAALRKAGWSLRRLSVHHGYHEQALSKAVARPWPKGERLIAAAIGVPPDQIWPGRFAQRALRDLAPRQRRSSGAASPSIKA